MLDLKNLSPTRIQVAVAGLQVSISETFCHLDFLDWIANISVSLCVEYIQDLFLKDTHTNR